MTLPSMLHVYRLKVRLQIFLWRYGWAWSLLLGFLAIALMLGWIYLPAQRLKLEAVANDTRLKQEQYVKLEQSPQILVVPAYEVEILRQLNEQVFAESTVGAVLKRITLIGQNKGLAISQSEFQTVQKTLEGQVSFRQLQVTLPVRANYLQIRQFTQEILNQMGGVSVDQISLKRENVALSQVDAKIKLSIWIDINKQAFTEGVKP